MATRLSSLLKENKRYFQDCLIRNVDVLNSLSKYLHEKNIVHRAVHTEALETERAATLLLEGIETALDNNPDAFSIITAEFNRQRTLKDLIDSLQAPLESESGSGVGTGSEQIVHQSPAVSSVSGAHGGTVKGGGGYEDELFLSLPPKQFQCPICYLTLKEPYLLECCGAHICQDCISRVANHCPVCRSKSFNSIIDRGVRGQILGLKVKCKYSPECPWTGELLDYEKHSQDTCLHVPVQCRLGCGQLVPRGQLTDHEDNSCEYRTIDDKSKAMQRLLLAKITDADGKLDSSEQLMQHFQTLLDRHNQEISGQREGRSELESIVEETLSELKQSVTSRFKDYEDKLTRMNTSFETSTADISEQMRVILSETTARHDEILKGTNQKFEEVKAENSELKEHSEKVEKQADRLQSSASKLMELLKQKTEMLAMKEDMMKKKDFEIFDLTERVKKLTELLNNNDISLAEELLLPYEATDDDNIKPADTHSPPQDDSEIKEELKPTQSNNTGTQEPTSTATTPTELPKDDKEISTEEQDELSSSSAVSIVDHGNRRDVSVQFDYWVPMKDLLYGATVVDETVFNAHGDKEQTFNWPECGFSLQVPEGALSRTETCPFAIKALISGRFKFPKGFQLISALYPISPGRRFKKKVKISLQHCFLIEREDQLKNLCFIKAHATGDPNDPYEFKCVRGGVFTVGSQYCELWQKDFSIYAAGLCAGGNPEGGDECHGNGEVAAGTGENTTGEEGSTTEEDTTTGEDTTHTEDTGPDNNETPPNVNNTSSADTSQTEPSGEREVVREEDPTHQPTGGVAISSPQVNLDPQLLYRAHLFYEHVIAMRNKWHMKLVAIKHLKVHIKYVTDMFRNEEGLESFKFRFLDPIDLVTSEPAIKLVFSPEQTSSLARGWFVKPMSTPCSIPKEDIDALCSQELRTQAGEEERVIPDLPMRQVSVFAEGETPSPHMEYTVSVEGIKEEKNINIIRHVENITTEGGVSRSPSNDSRPTGSNSINAGEIQDLRKLKEVLIDQLNQQYADLQSLLQGTLDDFAALLFQKGLISKKVKSCPKFDDIMSEITGSLKYKRSVEAVVDHCKKLLTILGDVGAPQRDASMFIAQDMADKVNEVFNVHLIFT